MEESLGSFQRELRLYCIDKLREAVEWIPFKCCLLCTISGNEDFGNGGIWRMYGAGVCFSDIDGISIAYRYDHENTVIGYCPDSNASIVVLFVMHILKTHHIIMFIESYLAHAF